MMMMCCTARGSLFVNLGRFSLNAPIFNGQRKKSHLSDELSPGSAVVMARKGCMTSSIFICWIPHFAQYKPVGDILLVYDADDSHQIYLYAWQVTKYRYGKIFTLVLYKALTPQYIIYKWIQDVIPPKVFAHSDITFWEGMVLYVTVSSVAQQFSKLRIFS